MKIKGEHVARVFDVGTLETGAPYIVMEYLHGSDLSEWLEKHGTLSVELAVETTKARAELGWAPRSMDEALREVMADELSRRGKKLPPALAGVHPRLE